MKFGTALFYRKAVSSPRLGLTSVVGIGTGITPAPWAPMLIPIAIDTSIDTHRGRCYIQSKIDV